MQRAHPVRSEASNVAFIGLGIVFLAMGLKGFLLSRHFIDGGVTGICMLIAQTAHVPIWVGLPAINAPFILLGYARMGVAFAVRSALGMVALAAVLALVPFPDVTPDRVLAAVFGGLFIGAGVGLAMRGNAVLDGTEVAALVLQRRVRIVKVGDIILLFNVVIFVVAIAVLGIEPALYSILTYVAAAKTLDFVLHGVDQYMAITIISAESERIRARLVEDGNRGVTVYRGFGGKSGLDQEIIFCVVTRLESASVHGAVQDIDPDAFLVTQPLSGAEGGWLKRTSHAH